MTKVFSMNSNKDIHTKGGRIVIAEGLEAVLQNCERAVKAQFQEMIYAYDRGVNYFQYVFGASPNVVLFEAGARRQLSRVSNVISVESFDAEVINNTVRYTAVIRTTFGTGTLTDQISG